MSKPVRVKGDSVASEKKKEKSLVCSVRFEDLTSGKKTFSYLEPGIYSFKATGFMMPEDIEVHRDEFKSDEVIDLPSAAFRTATKELTNFLSPETKKTYEHLGFLYKRSWLFYGIPGTGKSVLVKKFSEDIVRAGGLVFTNLNGIVGEKFNQYFHPANREQTMCIVIEEFEGVKDNSATLTALDGGTQRDNMVFLCTTNHIENIPPRLLRPGRIHSKIEVKPLELEARARYFSLKVEDAALAQKMAEVSEGLVIDELKEVVQQVLLSGADPVQVAKDLLAFRESAKESYYDPAEDENIQKAMIYVKN